MICATEVSDWVRPSTTPCSYAVQLYQPAMKLYETTILELKEHGQFSERRLSPETMAKVIRTAKYTELADAGTSCAASSASWKGFWLWWAQFSVHVGL